MGQPVNMRDIAERLGVSVKTVSGALNGTSARMSEETRRRIRQVADEMGYQTNVLARGMRQGVLPIISLVAEGVTTQPFATEIARSLDNAARLQGLMVVSVNAGVAREAALAVAEAQKFMPTAIIYATSFHREMRFDPALREAIRVLVNCRDLDELLPAILPDDFQAAYDITHHCLERGRRRIAFLNLQGIVAGRLREMGFLAACTAAGIDVPEGFVRPATRGLTYSELAPSLVIEQVTDLMVRPDPPDAILCGNDRVALEVYGVLRRLGRRIPEDVAVGGFDNQADIARRLDPPLTTMALPYREMGRRAAAFVCGEETKQPRVQKIPFRLVQRASV